MIPSFGLVLMLVCAVFFYKAAEMERKPPLVVAGLSLLLWLSADLFLEWGIAGCFMTQVALFLAMTIWSTMKDDSGRRRRSGDEELPESEDVEDS